MTDDLKSKLEARKSAVEKEFETLTEKDKTLSEQIKLAQQQRSAIRDRQLQLRGEFKQLGELLLDGEEKKAIPVETAVVKSKK